MLDKLRALARAANTWLVLAGAALAVLVDELAPVADLHPVLAWIVRAAGVAIVGVGIASRIVARSTEVPAPLRGLRPTGQTHERWAAWNGGQFRYIPPVDLGRRRAGNGPARPPQGPPPPTTAA